MQVAQRPVSERIAYATLLTLLIAGLVGALLLARYNVRAGRADRQGATRVAVFVVVVELVSWVTGYHHVADLRIEALSFSAIAGDAVSLGVILWIIYAALEPYARRFWPDMLLGWSRLVSGRIRDPRVGRDVLLGVAFGVAWFFLDIGRRLLPETLGYPATTPRLGFETGVLLGAAETISTWAFYALKELQTSFGVMLLLVFLRLLTRSAGTAMALGMLIILYWWSSLSFTPVLWSEITYEVLVVVLFTLVMTRFGLLTAAMTRSILGICQMVPFTVQVSHWSATASNLTIAAIVALALFGFYASRAGQPLFGNLDPDTRAV